MMPIVKGCWQLDNFYKPAENMDRVLTDCYFYYYSKCKNGKQCQYRHEPAALGHEVMCNRWLEGRCFNVKCKNRHMRIGKKRDQIQCFWENTATGCTKPHCVFRHNKQPQISQVSAISSHPEMTEHDTQLIQQQQQQQQQQHIQQQQQQQQHDLSGASSGVHSMIGIGDTSHMDLSVDRMDLSVD